MRRTFFTQRVVGLWNSLPQRVVEASSLAIFKRELDGALVAKGIRGYGEKAGTGYCWMISHDHIEWRCRLEGSNGLLLHLISMFLCFYVCGKFFYREGGGCLEHTARGGGGRFNSGIEETFGWHMEMQKMVGYGLDAD